MNTGTAPHYIESGAGPTVVFLHGIGGSCHTFDGQLAALGGTFRCVSWDMPGYGASAPLAELTFDALADALNALVDALQVDAVAVVGHSMGGMVAQHWAARAPQRCRRLVLAQTSAAFGKPGSTWNEEFLAARLKPLDAGKTPADFAAKLVASMFVDGGNADAVSKAVATMSQLDAATYRQVLECLVTFDGRDDLTKLTMPTLCLAADQDDTAPAKTMQRMREKLPNAEFALISNAGHLAYLEQPDAFNAALKAFLRQEP